MTMPKMRMLLGLLIVASCALAKPISSLHNTGQATPGQLDPYWTFSGGNVYVTDDAGFPFGPWGANSATSKWISPQASYQQGETDPAGDSVFATTFDLTGLNLADVWVTLWWGVDNLITDVMLNGVSIGHTFPGGDFTFPQPGPVTLSSGFAAGVNTLEFHTQNFPAEVGNPLGLRVEFTSEDGTIPEPATLSLLGIGLVGLSIAARRRR